jgi:hypothetical protein
MYISSQQAFLDSFQFRKEKFINSKRKPQIRIIEKKKENKKEPED